MFRSARFVTALLLAPAALMAYEEPGYVVLRATDAYEIRHYQPYIVAEVDVSGSANEAGNEAFRILAGYIFGNNDAELKMNMTAPVESHPVGDSAQRHTYAFVMERRYSLESLPKPDDPRIRFVSHPARVMAAVRFSGRWTDSNFQAHREQLLQGLVADAIPTRGDVLQARYDAPFKPWFLRRNEVLVEVDWSPEPG